MQTASLLPPCTLTPSPARTNYPIPKSFGFPNRNITCRASSSSSSNITDFDLYDLLGIESTCNLSSVKLAYRSLQKRCHPDIAGPAGHDMAIILNEAYSVLSDPISRMAYDKEQEKFSELRGYTGRALYSVWLGSESEERAVFVDEVKCVGCLKCALLAEKTFAVESVYGRARVVAQWADPENKIQEAIDACPVDCISTVERSNLAALEFLMSKQPRGNVRIGASNTAGARVSNIFVDVEKFQSKFQEASLKEESNVSDARFSAIGAIRSISNWLYWQSPGSSRANENLMHVPRKSSQPNIKKLQEAVMARKQARDGLKSAAKKVDSSSFINGDEYWAPMALSLPPSSKDNAKFETFPEPEPIKETIQTKGSDVGAYKDNRSEANRMIMRVTPVAAAAIAAVIVRLQVHEGAMVGQQIKEHVGGSFALGMVNSEWQPVVLTAVAWYLIAGYTLELLQPFVRKLIKIYIIKVKE
ncbi:chaperone protein dnaJ C76, chloroplastic [Impatiens glandulifera]|uniref:chaperone protein dnaJ C76, chloroplastic n=1 Tax=Impatiens glandulifera TaxID=253017 RepID=UPI001FB1718B|nr:chaperone protein dnaJ C76, chloroplastic [Impatiens glandulifera]